MTVEHGIIYVLMFISILFLIMFLWEFFRSSSLENDLHDEQQKTEDLQAQVDGLENRLRATTQTISEQQDRITDLVRNSISSTRQNRDSKDKP